MLLNKIIEVFGGVCCSQSIERRIPFDFAFSRTAKIIGASIIPLAFSIQDLMESRGSDSESRGFRVRFGLAVDVAPLLLASEMPEVLAEVPVKESRSLV